MKTKPSDQFPTDEWLMSIFRGWFDPCPLNPNPTIDGLAFAWKSRTYVNPPYSNVRPWVKKGIEESKKGHTVVFLLKFDSTTAWFRDLLEAGAHFLYLGERLRHGHTYAAPFPSMLAILTNGGKQHERP